MAAVVTRFSIAPVRSLGLEHPDTIDLTTVGVREDRRFYLVDQDGRLVDRLVSGRLAPIGAHTDADGERLRLTFPHGNVVEDDVRLGEAVETYVYGRTAVGHVVEGPWAVALEPYARRWVRLVRTDRPGGTRDRAHASLVSRASVLALSAAAEVADVDARRFRMLIEIDGTAAHEEDRWVGGRIAIGDAILRINERDARCAITTQNPDTGERDVDTLRTIIRYRGLIPDRHGAPKAMFGVLADIDQPGRIHLGDEVRVLD
ncbi:MAG TPA: MOSC N-terminal beta barrel domain-containing protein [Candidatus Polarisedimenticolia bacterium]|nr:MOSC N-terminal beta barrel domain-containing protein [Candidatus Polarisedimenticolia bacterium]